MRTIGAQQGASRPVELQQLIDAERAGLTMLVVRDRDDHQRLFVLEDDDDHVTVGRGRACDVAIYWDGHVSQLHAELIRRADGWVIADDGLSRNGTFVNGERVSGRRRLRAGDTIRCGLTSLGFREPPKAVPRTTPAQSMPTRLGLTPMQHKVLVALCRPCRDGSGFAVPATNAAIAAELVLSIDAIKTHLRALYEKFGVDHLPQNEKRVRLAEMALGTGVVSDHDF
jgi:pSer/pThr/pTyr-binding forkhead associated (FHA) protein